MILIYVFLKAIAQYNYRHYFKLECYIYFLVSYNHLNKVNTKTDNIYIYIYIYIKRHKN